MVGALALTLVLSAAAQAQGELSVERILDRSASLAAQGDTATAIHALESALERHRDEPRLLAELAWLHAARASEVTTEFGDRKAAERYALEAWRREPSNVKALGALALVRFKQHMTARALRYVRRAIESPGFSGAPPLLRAELHYLEGRCWERQVQDFEHLVRRPEALTVSTPECIGLGVFCLNFTRPRTFHDQLEAAPSLAQMARDEWRRMVAAYRAALGEEPGHMRALGALLVALLDADSLAAYLDEARRGVEASPDSARAHLWLGLGLQRAGATEEAAAAFRRGLELMPPGLRAAYVDPTPLLAPGDSAEMARRIAERGEAVRRLMWLKSDPLYLTEVNERWVEHLARVTYADLKFAPVDGSVRGSETEPGQIYVRYGPPRVIWSVPRDRSKEMDLMQVEKALETIQTCLDVQSGGGDPVACRQVESQARHLPKGGGRWVFWNYAPDRPSFVFTRGLEMPNLRFMRNSYSAAYAQEVRARLPSLYQPFETVLEVPHQVARFKGTGPDRATVRTYAALPLRALAEGRADSVAVGLFFFDAGYTRSYRWRRRIPAARPDVPFLFELALPAGYFEYSIEAYAAAASSVARARGSLGVSRYRSDTLSVSDLLVADTIVAVHEPVVGWRDLRVRGSTDLTFGPGEPVGLYWETYGLEAEGGVARYEVAIQVTGAAERGVVVRVIDALAGVFGGRERRGARVSWTREVTLDGRDRAVDWVLLGQLPEGRNRIVLTVRDLTSGAVAMAERYVWVRLEPLE